MEPWHQRRLTDLQASHIARWLPNPRLIRDMSWELGDSTVLDVDSGNGRVIVKAAGPSNHHIAREITAYRGFTEGLTRAGRASHLLHYDRDANILVTRYLEGSLVEGSGAESSPDTYYQAGELARVFHGQAERIDADWDADAVTKSVGWLDKKHRISPDRVTRLRQILADHRPEPRAVVPTHGDWQPRNWLIDAGVVKVIDFGRFAWRPAISDFDRLAVQQWRLDRELEDAFFSGYGFDPRVPEQRRMSAVHAAIGTAVWAFHVGDEPFERQGHRMIDEALALFDG